MAREYDMMPEGKLEGYAYNFMGTAYFLMTDQEYGEGLFKAVLSYMGCHKPTKKAIDNIARGLVKASCDIKSNGAYRIVGDNFYKAGYLGEWHTVIVEL